MLYTVETERRVAVDGEGFDAPLPTRFLPCFFKCFYYVQRSPAVRLACLGGEV
jgi:hypothetical protein